MPEQANADTQDETLSESAPESETDNTPETSGETPEATEQPRDQKSIDALNEQIKRMNAALKKANNEAKTYRIEADELKKFKEQTESEKLSEREKEELARQKLEQQLSESQKRLEAVLRQAEEDKINNQVLLLSSKLGFADPDDALAYIARHRSEIDIDEHGSPTNINDLLTTALKAKPHWKAQSTRTTVTSGGATNPPRSQTSNDNAEITWEYITKMQADPKAYEALSAERKRQISRYMNDPRNFRGR